MKLGSIATRVRRFASRLPAGIRAHGLLAVLRNRRLLYDASRREQAYARWVQRNPTTPECEPWEAIFFSVPTLFFSCVLNCDEAKLSHALATIESVRRQSFALWELHLLSASPLRREWLRRRFRGRMRLVIGPPRKPKLRGTHVVYLSPGDLLDEHALFWLYREGRERPEVDVIYSDEDRIDATGRRFCPWFKPGWSPELLLSQHYLGRVCAIRLEAAKRAGGVSMRYRSAGQYDLLLRLRAAGAQAHRVPRVLCHVPEARWRRALEARRERREEQLLRKHLAASGSRARVRRGRAPHTRIVRFPVAGRPIVSIIIPFRDKPELLARCVDSIFRYTSYPYFEILLVSNNSERKETKQLAARLGKRRRVRVFERNVPFNYSAVNNWAARRAVGDYLLFLNNDTEITHRGWLEGMLEYAQLPEVGAVGPRLLYPDGTLQHAGVIVGLMGMAHHLFAQQREATCYQRQASVVRNYLAVTAACLLVQQEKFWEAGGFDEEFILCGNDVALCLELHWHGYRNVYLPHVSLVHYEKTTRGEGTVPAADFYTSFRYYEQYMRDGDPYYSPNLTLHGTDASPRLQEEDFYPRLARQFGAAARSRGG